jgi:DNA polymerase-3 subunit delta
MKLDARRIDAFLKNPGHTRAVLLHGEDNGLIRERAALLVCAVAGSLDEPFRVSDLDRESHGRIVLEMTAQSLIGGRRVVRVREASDALTKLVQAALAGLGDNLLILEAGSLPAKSKLRQLAEQRSDFASIACYHENAGNLERTVKAVLGEFQVSIEGEALGWLTGQLGVDRGATRHEVEKLAIYAGIGGHIDLDAASKIVGDAVDLQLEDALFAATEGDVEGTDRAIDLALAEGAEPVGVLRATLLHLHRLQRARSMMDAGMSAVEATKALRPPVFFSRVEALASALRLWSVESAAAACVFIAEAERNCKRTGSPAELLCRHAVSLLARRSRGRRDGIGMAHV